MRGKRKFAAKKCSVLTRPAIHRRRDVVLEKFDRGEDILDYCDLGAGVLKIPLG